MRRRTIDDRLDEEMIGKVGRVTLGITPDHAGEVVVAIRGGTEAFAALCDEPVAKNTRVVVVECLSGRTVSVTPC
jgi:membrane protein implicated in regulation of membrane protease activity